MVITGNHRKKGFTKSITSIGGYAFNIFENLSLVTCLAETPPTIETDVFMGTRTRCASKFPQAVLKRTR